MDASNVGIIDGFLNTFETTIDSGFGLLRGSVVSLAGSLSVLDMLLAGLFWAWAVDEDIVQRLVKKTLYVGFFAFVINHFSHLASIVFNSFAALGLKAGGGTLTLADFMHPGRLAATGLSAAQPLLDAASKLVFSFGAIASIVQILVLLLCWFIVLAAFFILAVQLFVAIVEFKLTSLAGFVLIPFALFNRTAFLAEKVLGNVVSSGVKIMVLAVISAIASVLFKQLTTSYGNSAPTIGQALSVVLASLCMVGLAIFGGSLANGLISGAPQLGAGAAVGTGMAVGAMGAAAVAAPAAIASGGGAVLAATAAAARGGAAAAGAASSAYSVGAMSAAGGSAGARMAAGLGGVARAPGAAAMNAAKSRASGAAASMKQSYGAGARSAFTATGGRFTGGSASDATSGGGGGEAGGSSGSGGGNGGPPSGPDSKPPRWAQKMKRRNAATHAAEAAHVIRSADGGGGSASIDLSEKQ
ncbi:P-type conjugative transfer protein TrbL [Acetobacter tropicalis]|uniref:Conjugative transfer protein TrbL n=2 Tax=Acetobacter tropicalis TaxID=104102 RepID=A0A094YTS6_9PROT|nr:P-type conjugative transfer protein TrbL [Acetobacter tropicalis]KAA8385227.1 P-type conjugative transfer protein TrbL [Acetobacter tropicalis]KAA8389798.1 P-type conjugative transfer protein TrbL [Acetobacter tropicalis]KGB24792.1 Conjugative transfer protein TrbL [Acetobacter tropicalis]MDO8172060.1 P-type conjugative transfer protein TrbL [Acetobacter tropicalis]